MEQNGGVGYILMDRGGYYVGTYDNVTGEASKRCLRKHAKVFHDKELAEKAANHIEFYAYVLTVIL